MRKFLFAITVLMVTLASQAQFIHGSVKKSADPTKIDIVFKSTYTSATGEYVSGLQFTMAIPVGVSAGVTAVAVGVNTFSNMGTLTAVPAYTEGSERIYSFIFANPAVATQSWTNGVDFVGAVVTFSTAAAAAVGKMVDFTNMGGGTGFAYFSMATTLYDPTDYGNVFYGITGESFTGTYPSGDPFVQTGTATSCSAGIVNGTSSLCIGQTTTFTSNGDAGGSWSSTNAAIATVNSTTGLVTAVSAGTTNITYTVNTGCSSPVSAFKTLTVSPNENAGTVSGTSPLNVGATATYTSNGSAGGTWSSSNMDVATVNASTGVVTAVSGGTTSITYTISTGCGSPVSAFKTLTIIAATCNAGTVSGASPLCIGATATYSSNGDTGGSWSSTNTAVATVNSSTGLVTAAGVGTTNITYTVSTGCNSPVSAFKTLTVSADPNQGTVSGTSPLCIGATSIYSSNGSQGGNWSSTNAAVATVSSTSGLVTAVSTGTTDIVYTIFACNGSSLTASQSLTVSPNANAGTISGTSPLCSGATATFTSNGDAGGSWSSTNTAVATVNSSTGLVTAIGVGATEITYTVSTGCNSPAGAFKTLTVSADPSPGTVSGTSPLCIGAAATYSSNGAQGGNWSSTNTAVATVNSSTGLVTAGSAGTTDIVYTILACNGSPLTASKSLTVSTNSTVGASSSTPTLCINTALTSITHTTTGATGIGAATGLPAGVTAAWAANTITISGAPTASGTFNYSIPLTGCGNVNATGTITVTANNTVSAASATPTLCINTTLTPITYTTTGATGIGAATGLPAGVTVAWAANTITISGTPTASGTYNYSIPLTGGCAFINATGTITVSSSTNVGTVSGTSPLCIGATATYTSNGDAGGNWSSTNTAVATVNSTSGLVTALSAGTTDILYTVLACNGSPLTVSKTLTVSPGANAGTVSGTSPLCVAATATYSSNGDAGGSWSSTNTAIATVNSTTGLVTAVSVGTTNITYTLSSTGCSNSASAFKVLTISPNVSAGTVNGTSPLCIGATATYTSNGTPGGTWSSSVPAVASVNATSGLVTALTAGTTDITYTISAGCGSPVSAFKTLTVTACQNFTCGRRKEKVIVCHNGHEICIDSSALRAHLAHGDVLGPCPGRPVTPGNNNAIEHSDKLVVTAFPNPYTDKFRLNINSPVTGMATIQFYNTIGNKAYELKQYVISGNNNVVDIKSTTLFKAFVFYKIIVGDYQSSGIVLKQE